MICLVEDDISLEDEISNETFVGVESPITADANHILPSKLTSST